MHKNADISENTGNKWLTLLAIAISGIVVIIDISIVNISFPALTRIFETDTSVVLWVSAVYTLVSAGLTPVFGRMGDMYGRKKIYIIGLILFTIGLGLCSVSQNISHLIIARAAQGTGAAMVIALSMAIITAVFPEKERGRALGVLSSCYLIGPLIGPTVGAILLETLGWRSIFYIRIPICIIVLVLAWVLLREQKPAQATDKLDLWGAAFLVSGISCLVLFFNVGGRVSYTDLSVLALLAASIILMVIFVLKARRTEHPIVDLNLFKNRIFTGSNITVFLQSFAIAVQMLIMPYYLIDGRGFSTVASGLLMAVGPIFIVAISPISGWLSDKVGSKLLCPAGMALSGLSLFLLSLLGSESTYTEIIIALAIFGVGDAIFLAPVTSVIMGTAPNEKLGVASAMMNTIRTIGISTGTVIAGAIFTTRQAFHAADMAGLGLEADILEKLSLIGGFQDAILMGAIAFGIGIFTAIVGTIRPDKPTGGDVTRQAR